VDEQSDDGAFVSNSFQIGVDGVLLVTLVLEGVLGEGLSLAAIPIFIEAPLAFFRDVLGPDSGQRSESLRSIDVSDNSDGDHGWCFKDSDGLDHFLLVKFRSRLFNLSNDVSATGLVAHESGQMWLLRVVILGKALDFSFASVCPLFWQKTERTTSWCFKFSV